MSVKKQTHHLQHLLAIKDAEIDRLKKILEGIHPPQNLNSKMSKDLRELLIINKIEIQLADILYIKAASPYCLIYFENSTQLYEPRISLKTIESYFDTTALTRIHNSYLINPQKVLSATRKGARDYEVWLKDRSRRTLPIPIARAYLSNLRQEHANWFY